MLFKARGLTSAFLLKGTNPLSGDIYGSVRSQYVRLRKGGPNDGLTLLADELLPNGIAVIEPGIDHFFAAPDIEIKSVALANVVAGAIHFRQKVYEFRNANSVQP